MTSCITGVVVGGVTKGFCCCRMACREPPPASSCCLAALSPTLWFSPGSSAVCPQNPGSGAGGGLGTGHPEAPTQAHAAGSGGAGFGAAAASFWASISSSVLSTGPLPVGGGASRRRDPQPGPLYRRRMLLASSAFLATSPSLASSSAFTHSSGPVNEQISSQVSLPAHPLWPQRLMCFPARLSIFKRAPLPLGTSGIHQGAARPTALKTITINMRNTENARMRRCVIALPPILQPPAARPAAELAQPRPPFGGRAAPPWAHQMA
mmetsp:Transcript_8036/g.16938  ORF Transcript_8036/g.16938 Transcript_8036/m.16938 type:complete len:265 (+) Transcript_8036:727-1521(+)